jgi:hypothetical protein
MRGIILSDLHCGHIVGLTHPDWHWQSTNTKTRVGKVGRLQREIWETYASQIEKEYDFAFLLGDLVDGSGAKAEYTEHVAVERSDQVEMSLAALSVVSTRAWYAVRGTTYHVGNDEWENDIAKQLPGHVEIGDQLFPEAHGIIFDLRHHTGKTSVPHGTTGGPKKAHIHNILWAEKGMQPKAHITIRGHIHEYCMIDDSLWTGVTCPALQALGCKYGRRLDSQVDFGFLEIEITSGGVQWTKKIRPVAYQAKKSLRIPCSSKSQK